MRSCRQTIFFFSIHYFDYFHDIDIENICTATLEIFCPPEDTDIKTATRDAFNQIALQKKKKNIDAFFIAHFMRHRHSLLQSF